MSGIVWLASYPKSGNTWVRAFISNLINEADEEISINKMKTDGIFSSRRILDKITGVESSNLSDDEIDRLRPEVYNYLARTTEKPLFIKVHDAYTYLENGMPLLGTVQAKAVYIIRNPLDVAVSLANHYSVNIDEAIAIMCDESYAVCNSKKRLPEQLRQKQLSWSSHIESWANASELPVYFMRYEDMKTEPIKAFSDAVRFIGLDCTEERIRQAVEASSFEKLKAEEEQSGFGERPVKTASFFRSGKTGDWKNHLSDEQRDKIITNHEAVMKKYGYVDSDGRPVY